MLLSTTALAQAQSEGLAKFILPIAAVFAVLFGFIFLLALVRRYKRCPSNKVLVIYGKVREGRAARTIHGGGAFVWPIINDFDYLSLDPIQIEIPLQGALSIENIRVSVPSVFTVAIGTDEATMNNASIRLLSLETSAIVKLAEEIIFGQLRQVIASMKIEDINRDRDAFLHSIQNSLEPELRKIGLVLINVNIRDISDESGFIEAIGRKAASTAIQQALIDVAEQEKKGAIGVAEAERERAVLVANAEKVREIGTKEAEREKLIRLADLDKEKQVGQQNAHYEQESQVRDAERAMRIRVADANAKAVSGENDSKAAIAATNAALRVREADATATAITGENKAKAQVAAANADLRVREAEAFRVGETKHREADAQVRQAQYVAEAAAAEAQGKKLEAEKRAELESVARAVKAQVIVDAEAEAAKKKIEAEGEAAAIFAKLKAEADGQFQILARKGEGLKHIVDSCGGPQAAFQMLMLEHMDTLSANAAKAISSIKFDKVVVWDSGATGKGAAGFLQSLGSSLPPMLSIMRDIGGVQMPDYFGKLGTDAPPPGGGAAPTPGPTGAGAPPRPKA